MSADKRLEEGGTFSCYLCHLTENYDYYGRKPRFLRSVVFLEDCYVMKDPFSGPSRTGDKFLVLGSDCVACGESVCQAAKCSVFYTKRFCLTCARANNLHFPPQLVAKLPK